MKWKLAYFAGSAVLAAYFLVHAGAPPLAVAAGIGGAAMFMRRKARSI
jgi:hypothetical protein